MPDFSVREPVCDGANFNFLLSALSHRLHTREQKSTSPLRAVNIEIYLSEVIVYTMHTSSSGDHGALVLASSSVIT